MPPQNVRVEGDRVLLTDPGTATPAALTVLRSASHARGLPPGAFCFLGADAWPSTQLTMLSRTAPAFWLQQAPPTTPAPPPLVAKRVPPGHPARSTPGADYGLYMGDVAVERYVALCLYDGSLSTRSELDILQGAALRERGRAGIFRAVADVIELDGKRPWRLVLCGAPNHVSSPGALANDPRGTGRTANAALAWVLCRGACACMAGGVEHAPHLHGIVYSTRPLEPREEILWNYGKDYFDSMERLSADPPIPPPRPVVVPRHPVPPPSSRPLALRAWQARAMVASDAAQGNTPPQPVPLIVEYSPLPDNVSLERHACMLCLDDTCDPTVDPIVACDAPNCSVGAHLSCHGLPHGPGCVLPPDWSEPWHCHACSLRRDAARGRLASAPAPACVLCSRPGGAMLPCAPELGPPGSLAHALCASWRPETRVRRAPDGVPTAVLRTPSAVIDPKPSLACGICRRRGGCLECSTRGCSAGIHPLCAVKVGCLLELHLADRTAVTEGTGATCGRRVALCSECTRRGAPGMDLASLGLGQVAESGSRGTKRRASTPIPQPAPRAQPPPPRVETAPVTRGGRTFPAGSLKAAICAVLQSEALPGGVHVTALLERIRASGLYQPPPSGCGSGAELPQSSLISALNDPAFERCARATFRLARGAPHVRPAQGEPSPSPGFAPPSSCALQAEKRAALSSDEAAEEEEEAQLDAAVLVAEAALANATELRIAAVASAERATHVLDLARAAEREARRRLQAARAAARGE